MHNRIRFLRERRRWTQSDVAQALGVAVSTIRRWETGDTIPYVYHLLKLCDLFETTQQDLGFPQEGESTPSFSGREHPSTYFVQDRSNENELMRLKIQDESVTQKIGFISDFWKEKRQSVLDVGCGTGGWLIKVAKLHPEIQTLVGVDISKRMTDFAREWAKEEGVDDRVSFLIMDALRMLEFPNGQFDFVNQRFGTSYLRTWDWSKLLNEYIRVLRPVGVIRIAELEVPLKTSSDAYRRWWNLFVEAFRRAGHIPENETIGQFLLRLFRAHGLSSIEMQKVTLDYPANAPETTGIIQDAHYALKTAEPFVRKWHSLSSQDYAELCKEVESDFYENFSSLTVMSVVTGQK